MKEIYRSRVYTDRPEYADLESPEKFQAILGIIGTHLRKHPKAVCSYSGGADSDILIDMLETARKLFGLAPHQIHIFQHRTGNEGHKRPCKGNGRKVWSRD